jgi:hypothetical protein
MNKQIHPKIKETLGFDISIPDKEFLKIWKQKTTQVCKPCWELKYCPYGPFVEQSPLLPSLRDSSAEHNEYLKNCLATNMIGVIKKLSPEEIEKKKDILAVLKEYPRFLLPEIFREMNDEELIAEGVEKNLELFDLYQTPYNNFEKYKVPFPLDEDEEKSTEKVLEKIKKIKLTPELNKRIKEKIDKLKEAIKTGIDDQRKPLDSIRKKYFKKSVAKFKPEDFPEYIPEVVSVASCNIFGHICPVVFVGESISETSEKRRKGRYISFKIKMRVVRRDNYTCQECTKHLKDDEVEFDHIIPVSKGGSSEEHNIRLTCYDCNRDKLDTVQI